MTVKRSDEQLRALMKASLLGDASSYRLLLTDVSDRLRAYYSRRLHHDHAVVEDLLQETLIALHLRRSTYDVERPFAAWLYAIARYKLVDHLRIRHAHRHVPLDEVADLLAFTDEEAGSARFDVERLLDTMSPQARDLVRAVKIEGRSIAEVSASSGLTESAVKVAIHRALKRLAGRLRNSGTP